MKFAKPLLWTVLMIAAAAAGYSLREFGSEDRQVAPPPSAASGDPSPTNMKIIVGEQAQKNLGLTAKPVQAEVFWKTIVMQGMIVDRPGFSDREIVAPTTGIITRLYHVPGDVVRTGDRLFTMRLASESLQQTQTELFKASQDITLAQARRERLIAGGGAIPKARVIEVENEIARLNAVTQGYRQELANRGLTAQDIEGVAAGKLLSEITLTVPAGALPAAEAHAASGSTSEQPLAYELQQLSVELGEQVQAGQTLCNLSNHQLLAIEGQAFRDETALLEQSVQQGWPVEVDFQEGPTADWPAIDEEFPIRYIANTVDPVTRTFAFLMPLENQSKTVERGDRTQLLWRFRPGQKVLLRIRVEQLEDVFVLPADAVVVEGAEAFVFTQNVNTFERKGVHVLFRDRDRVVLANDGSLPTYQRAGKATTIPAIARTAAAQLNRMTKVGTSGVPKGYHIHADGSLHKNEDEGK